MNKIKQLRKKTGLTQKDFSSFTGIPKRTIENWENESRNSPNYIATLLECYIENELENFLKK